MGANNKISSFLTRLITSSENRGGVAFRLYVKTRAVLSGCVFRDKDGNVGVSLSLYTEDHVLVHMYKDKSCSEWVCP